MSNTTFIYGLFDPRNYQLRYVGKADNVEKRLSQHIKQVKHRQYKNRYVCNWIRQLLSEGLTPSVEILEECTQGSWKEKEIAWITDCKKFGLKLCNLTNGGDGTQGYVFSDETKQKLSDMRRGKTTSLKGQSISEEHRDNISKALKGKPSHRKGKTLSDEHRAKIKNNASHHGQTDEAKKRISEASKNRVVSEETRKKIGASSKGRNVGIKRSEETKRKMSVAQLKRFAKERESCA